MVSSERKARQLAKSRREKNRANIARANESRAVRTQLAQPRNANRVVPVEDPIPDAEFQRLPHSQVVGGRVVRANGINPQWEARLIRFYECWWQVSSSQFSCSF